MAKIIAMDKMDMSICGRPAMTAVDFLRRAALKAEPWLMAVFRAPRKAE